MRHIPVTLLESREDVDRLVNEPHSASVLRVIDRAINRPDTQFYAMPVGPETPGNLAVVSYLNSRMVVYESPLDKLDRGYNGELLIHSSAAKTTTLPESSAQYINNMRRFKELGVVK